MDVHLVRLGVFQLERVLQVEVANLGAGAAGHALQQVEVEVVLDELKKRRRIGLKKKFDNHF